MSTAVNPPKTPITAGSKAIAAATLPNVCKMPGPPAPFVPTPLPNIGKSDNSPQGYSTTVTIDGAAVAIQGATFNSIGDVASQGTGGGIVSNNVQGPTSFIAPGSMDVKVEGKNVQLLGDQMLNNGGPSGSPANAATMMGAVQAPGQPVPLAVVEGVLCTIFCECLAQEQARKFEMPLPDVEAVYDPEFDPDVKPGRAANQECVEKKFNAEYAGNMPNVKAEQTFDMGTNPPSPLPDSFRGMPGTRRPDFTVSTPSGLRVLEMKFPGDRWRRGQRQAYRAIAGGSKPAELTQDTCGC